MHAIQSHAINRQHDAIEFADNIFLKVRVRQMMDADKEQQRLEALRDYGLDRPGKSDMFDALLKMATEISGVPSAAINIIADTEQINLAQYNWNVPDTLEREVTFCTWVVDQGAPMEVPDARLDPRFADSAFVTPEAGLRYYLGVPLASQQGHVFGTLCIGDSDTHQLSDQHLLWLQDLAKMASKLLEVHRAEHHRARVTNIMALQTEVLQQATIGKPMQVLAQELITGLENNFVGARASLMAVTEDGNRLTWVAGSPFLAEIEANTAHVRIGPLAPPCGLAAHRRAQIFSHDVRIDPDLADYKSRLLDENILAYFSTPLFAEGGEVIGTLTLYFDQARLPSAAEQRLLDLICGTAAIVIERAKVLRSLVESERQLNEAQSIARLGAYTVFTDTGWRTGAEITNEILGLPPGGFSLSTSDYNKMVHPDDLPKLTAERALAEKNGAPLHTRYRIIRANDKAVRWIEARGLAVRGIDGEILRHTGVIQDVTERHLAEQSLRLNQRAVDSSSNGIVIVDAVADDFPMLYVNAAFEKMTGYTQQELIGKNCRFLQGELRNQQGRWEIRDAIEQSIEGSVVLQNFHKNGTPYWIDLRISPVRDDNGVLTHYVGFQNDISDRVRYEKELAHQAGHDMLTGLANRSLLKDRIDRALLHAQKNSSQLAVVFIDLDRFKIINDSLGHAAGDALLKEWAQRIYASCNDNSSVARLGGDEFAVLIEDVADEADAMKQAEKILAGLQLPFFIEGQHLSVSVSAGIALFPQHGDNTATLLRNADIAMYHAKTHGRANCQLFFKQLDAHAGEKLALKESLLVALREQQFCLHYQPKIDAQSHQLVGFEALVRWNHPERGLLYPGSFIDAAEEWGLIAELGGWVLGEACRQMQRWQLAGQYPVSVAINVSASQFRKGSFVEDVKQALADNDLAPSRLELEVTESSVMESPEQFIQILSQLDTLGVAISVDDFGTGYSSLSFIKQFPINCLKIDRSFVRDIGSDQSDAAICETIIIMAHNLGLLVVAEGVETLEQAEFLRDRGCDILQGYLIARPASAQTQFKMHYALGSPRDGVDVAGVGAVGTSSMPAVTTKKILSS